MRKLILAILAVICVDVGFVAYKSLADQTDSASKDVNVRSDREDLAKNSPTDVIESPQPAEDLTTAEPNADLALSTPERSVPARPRHSRGNRIGQPVVGRTYTAKLYSPERKTDLRLPNRIDLPSTIIYYPGQKPSDLRIDKETAGERLIDRRYDSSNQSMKTPPRSENRSLIARAWPIIKKPYDWIKAVGSRLY